MNQKVKSVSLRDALRTETYKLHKHLEKTVDARGFFKSHAGYVQWLVIMQQMHHQFSADYAAGCVALGLPSLSERLSTALVLDTGEDMPAVHTHGFPAGSEIGVAYVFEGSAMGARLLLRRAQVLAPLPTEYLSTLVRESRVRWPLVKQRCADVTVLGPAREHPAIEGARSVFKAFQRAFAAELV